MGISWWELLVVELTSCQYPKPPWECTLRFVEESLSSPEPAKRQAEEQPSLISTEAVLDVLSMTSDLNVGRRRELQPRLLQRQSALLVGIVYRPTVLSCSQHLQILNLSTSSMFAPAGAQLEAFCHTMSWLTHFRTKTPAPNFPKPLSMKQDPIWCQLS